MDIPLKSRPKVSMVNLLDDSKFSIGERNDNSKVAPSSSEDNAHDVEHQTTYKLTRTYSDSEKSNFDAETGHRLFDDGKIRPQMSRNNSHTEVEGLNRIYSRSHNQFSGQKLDYFTGLEDEYIPGLDFSVLVYEWNNNLSNPNLANVYNENGVDSQANSSTQTPTSNEGSYLDLNKLHAQVAPQPIRLIKPVANKYSFTKLSDYMRLRTPNSHASNEQTLLQGDNNKSGVSKNKRQRQSVVDPVTGDINYEVIIDNLPHNFNELPYSQRKKLVKSFGESIDYSQFSLFAKQYVNDRADSGNRSFRSSSSGENSHRRSRRNSTNTVAGKLLALSSVTDFKKVPEKKKYNVDEKDAIVMDHVLGKIIGFGAWGTIRECVAPDGTVRAVKIVKSWSGMDSGHQSKYEYVNLRHHNPKILSVFKREISIWEQLKHDNVLPLLDHLETEGAIFCLTERISGGTLFETISAWGVYNQGSLNSNEPYAFSVDTQEQRLQKTVAFTKQIVESLYYLHEDMGIVHGDIKSENILIDDTDPSNKQVVLCDFGMSRVFSARLGRNSPKFCERDPDVKRSRSSMAEVRKPYGASSPSVKKLFRDDSKIGISDLSQRHGPSPQSLSWGATSKADLSSYAEQCRVSSQKQLEAFKIGLPHSHIGSLPYASPELLLPSPPPLGPSADVWALGVLLYTMIVGRLPFQHLYEPRLRATITAGKFNKEDLRQACLMQCGIHRPSSDSTHDLSGFLSQTATGSQDSVVEAAREKWSVQDHTRHRWLYDVVVGCLQADITKRLDIVSVRDMVNAATSSDSGSASAATSSTATASSTAAASSTTLTT